MTNFPHERVVRYLDYPREKGELPVFNSARDEFIRPDWMAITRVAESPNHPETFILYMLTTEGEILDLVQRSSLEIALDEAKSIAGLSHSAWNVCDVVMSEWDLMPRAVIR